ncbi:MAG: hypothetical protein OXE86_16090 [Alphaproteobacteria bacterium]|nr:hypothetical protein [Alphaproteobacteria bacterium]
MSEPSTHQTGQTIPTAEIIQILEQPDGSSALELRVNVKGRDSSILLPLSALENHELIGLAVVKELRQIHGQISAIADLQLKAMELSGSQATLLNNNLIDVVDALRHSRS